ncbi:MAG: copper resistance protein NlpE N-terminal domain-containing protein [Chitinophagaceae bacterium]
MVAACSCNSDSTTSIVKDSTGLVPDSTAVMDTSIVFSKADTVLFGFYQGLLPCKDCEGIRQTLLLKDSGLFKLEEFTMDKDIFPRKQEGRWSRVGDSIHLQANRKLIATYFIKKDTLQLAYRDGSAIADSTVKSYWIARHPDAAQNTAWKKKQLEGIDFYAIGNEPFWNIEIGKEKNIVFRLADLPKPVILPVVQPVINKDSVYYSIKTKDATMQISIYNQFCNDGMSDNLYEHRVLVRYNGVEFKGCGVVFK